MVIILLKALMSNSNVIIGLDNFNSYYDKQLKFDRLEELLLYSKRRLFMGIYKADLNRRRIN